MVVTTCTAVCAGCHNHTHFSVIGMADELDGAAVTSLPMSVRRARSAVPGTRYGRPRSLATPAPGARRPEPGVRSPEPGVRSPLMPPSRAFLTKTIFLMEYRKVPSGYVTVGSQLVSRPETLDDLFSQPDAEPGGNPWDERVPPPGRDGTLLAIVPIPGTGTSLAIVGYAIATASGATATGAATNGTTNGATNGVTATGATINGAGHQGWPDESDPATKGPAAA